jgi:hypothetical protein
MRAHHHTVNEITRAKTCHWSAEHLHWGPSSSQSSFQLPASVWGRSQLKLHSHQGQPIIVHCEHEVQAKSDLSSTSCAQLLHPSPRRSSYCCITRSLLSASGYVDRGYVRQFTQLHAVSSATLHQLSASDTRRRVRTRRANAISGRYTPLRSGGPWR